VNDNFSVARDFSAYGIRGTISFISPLSDDFCAACNRLRLTADGAIKSCLLYPAELSLREALRNGASDEDIASEISAALSHKEFSHPPECALPRMDNRCMTDIGG
jgi:cyclic pyranopterin phosphate synthase